MFLLIQNVNDERRSMVYGFRYGVALVFGVVSFQVAFAMQQSDCALVTRYQPANKKEAVVRWGKRTTLKTMEICKGVCTREWWSELGLDLQRWGSDTKRIMGSWFDAKRRKDTAAFTASSPFLAYSFIDCLKDINAHTVLELGAGNGELSAPIARWLCKRGDSTPTLLTAVEGDGVYTSNLTARLAEARKESANHFVEVQQNWFSDSFTSDKAAHVAQGYDAVISTLPWTKMDDANAASAMRGIVQNLKDDGVFFWVSYVGADTLGTINAKRSGEAALLEYAQKRAGFAQWLNQNFDSFGATKIWSNVTLGIPVLTGWPMWVFWAFKKPKTA